MRIVLQQKSTGLFYRGPGAWTLGPTEAFDFGNSQKAIEFAWFNRWTEVRVVAVFFNPGCVDMVAFPLPRSMTEAAQREAA